MPREITSNTGSYPKFKAIGDYVVGRLQSFQRDVPGTFGPEDTAKMIGDNGETLIVRCQTDLANLIEENFETLKDQRVKYLFHATAPSKKGNPVKKFKAIFLDDDDMGFPPLPPKDFPVEGDSEEAVLERRLAEARKRRAA